MVQKVCKYCGKELKKVMMPPESDWGAEYLWICMNDDCGYFQRGWDWMKENYKVTSSYRYKINPVNGSEGPIPVTSPDDMKDWIVHKFEEEEG